MEQKNGNYKKTLSVVIVSYNSEKQIGNCLESIYNDKSSSDYEIIVVDNASKDDTKDLIQRKYPEAVIIANAENRGFAAASNQGIKIAGGKYILLLNPDTLVKRGCLGACVNFINNNPEAGIVGCRILFPDGSVQPSMRDFPTLWNCFVESFFLYKIFRKTFLFGKYHGSCYDYTKIQEANVLLGAFLLIRRSVIDQIGMLDERFFLYAEETDFCYRAKAAGLKNVFFPGGEIVHSAGGSAEQTSISSFIYLHESLNKYADKHFKKVMVSMFKALLFAGVVLRVILWSFITGITFKEFAGNKSRVYRKVLLWYLNI